MSERDLACACCGDMAGHYRQWPNQDTGYGLCLACVNWLRAKGYTEERLTDLYGRAGVHRP